MKDWKKFVASRTLKIEEYYISIPTQYDVFQFRVRYVKHDGYTLILPIDHVEGELSVFGKMFIDWFKFRSDRNTRYDGPHWWRPIRFNRKKRLIIWSVASVNTAYDIFKAEMVDKTINE